MSIQDYFRRGQWMFEGIDTGDSFDVYDTIIIDVFWLTFRDILNHRGTNKNYIPVANNIVNIMDDLKQDSKLIIVMPSQKTRMCYNGLLEESHRYAYDYNLHVLREHSKLMSDIYSICSERYESESDVLIVKNNNIFNENEEIITIIKTILDENLDKILVYTMSADFFVHSIFKHNKRLSFYDGNRVYNTDNVYNYFNQIFNLSTSTRKHSLISVFMLFGSAFFPIHYECNIFLLTDRKFEFFYRLLEYMRITTDRIGAYFEFKEKFILIKSIDFWNTIHEAIKSIDIDLYNRVFEFLDRSGSYYLNMLVHYKIASDDNSLGYIDSNFSYPENSVIEYSSPPLGYMLAPLYMYTLFYYITYPDKLDKTIPSGSNLYYDSSMFSIYYLDGKITTIAPINLDITIYSDTSYILRTNSKIYINNYLNDNTLRQDQLKVIKDRVSLNSYNPGFLEATTFIDSANILNNNPNVVDIFSSYRDQHRQIYSIPVPYMPLVDKFIHRHM